VRLKTKGSIANFPKLAKLLTGISFNLKVRPVRLWLRMVTPTVLAVAHRVYTLVQVKDLDAL
jgi:hypothetical protein